MVFRVNSVVVNGVCVFLWLFDYLIFVVFSVCVDYGGCSFVMIVLLDVCWFVVCGCCLFMRLAEWICCMVVCVFVGCYSFCVICLCLLFAFRVGGRGILLIVLVWI